MISLVAMGWMTKSRGEPMISLIAMSWIHLMFVLILMNIHIICFKLKSGFRIIHKFLTMYSRPMHFD
jgi:hypothetical protein